MWILGLKGLRQTANVNLYHVIKFSSLSVLIITTRKSVDSRQFYQELF